MAAGDSALAPSRTLKAIYHDRWPVEQLPLSAKQMLGAYRQFVHAAEVSSACQN